MSQLLIDKIRKARESQLIAGGYTFTIRRPTDMEVADMKNKQIKQGDIMHNYVVGWSLLESDLIPGGSGVKIDFDADLFIEWVSDRPDLWNDIVQGILDLYDTHRHKLDDELGKQGAG